MPPNDNPYAAGTAKSAMGIPLPNNRPHTFAAGMMLLVTSIGWVFGLLFGVGFFVMAAFDGGSSFPMTMYLFLAVCIVYNILLAFGSVAVLRRGSLGLAKAVFCMALVPLFGPFYLLGTVIGVCGLLALRRPEAQASFGVTSEN